MGKLLDSLRKNRASKQATSKRHSLVFLVHQGDIREALQSGWTAKQIWEQMCEDGMTAMSYATFCRLVKKHAIPSLADENRASHSSDAAYPLSQPSLKSRNNISTKISTPQERKFSEKERLDRLKVEAFAAARGKKSIGSLIGKPKSREEENQELFGK